MPAEGRPWPSDDDDDDDDSDCMMLMMMVIMNAICAAGMFSLI